MGPNEICCRPNSSTNSSKSSLKRGYSVASLPSMRVERSLKSPSLYLFSPQMRFFLLSSFLMIPTSSLIRATQEKWVGTVSHRVQINDFVASFGLSGNQDTVALCDNSTAQSFRGAFNECLTEYAPFECKNSYENASIDPLYVELGEASCFDAAHGSLDVWIKGGIMDFTGSDYMASKNEVHACVRTILNSGVCMQLIQLSNPHLLNVKYQTYSQATDIRNPTTQPNTTPPPTFARTSRPIIIRPLTVSPLRTSLPNKTEPPTLQAFGGASKGINNEGEEEPPRTGTTDNKNDETIGSALKQSSKKDIVVGALVGGSILVLALAGMVGKRRQKKQETNDQFQSIPKSKTSDSSFTDETERQQNAVVLQPRDCLSDFDIKGNSSPEEPKLVSIHIPNDCSSQHVSPTTTIVGIVRKLPGTSAGSPPSSPKPTRFDVLSDSGGAAATGFPGQAWLTKSLANNPSQLSRIMPSTEPVARSTSGGILRRTLIPQQYVRQDGSFSASLDDGSLTDGEQTFQTLSSYDNRSLIMISQVALRMNTASDEDISLVDDCDSAVDVLSYRSKLHVMTIADGLSDEAEIDTEQGDHSTPDSNDDTRNMGTESSSSSPNNAYHGTRSILSSSNESSSIAESIDTSESATGTGRDSSGSQQNKKVARFEPQIENSRVRSFTRAWLSAVGYKQDENAIATSNDTGVSSLNVDLNEQQKQVENQLELEQSKQGHDDVKREGDQNKMSQSSDVEANGINWSANGNIIGSSGFLNSIFTCSMPKVGVETDGFECESHLLETDSREQDFEEKEHHQQDKKQKHQQHTLVCLTAGVSSDSSTSGLSYNMDPVYMPESSSQTPQITGLSSASSSAPVVVLPHKKKDPFYRPKSPELLEHEPQHKRLWLFRPMGKLVQKFKNEQKHTDQSDDEYTG